MTAKKNSVLTRCTILLCLLLVAVLTVSSGCDYKGYSGKDVDLYTVAINSVLWNLGHSSDADRFCDSQIEVIEKDAYGRTLFVYHEKHYVEDSLAFSALIISQYSTDGYVYYYEDNNYIIKEQSPYEINSVNFEQEKIDIIKVLNDWNNELDLSKCTKKEINKKKPNIPTDNEAIKNNVLEELEIKDNKRMHLFYLTGDNNGNYLIYGTAKPDAYSYIHFVAFVTSEGEIKEMLVPQEPYNYQSELKELKMRNGWTNK